MAQKGQPEGQLEQDPDGLLFSHVLWQVAICQNVGRGLSPQELDNRCRNCKVQKAGPPIYCLGVDMLRDKHPALFQQLQGLTAQVKEEGTLKIVRVMGGET